jgi:K+-transporting ATPase ATPase C chain
MKTFITALRTLAVLTILTGLLYPLAITGAARVISPEQTGGSLVERNGQVVGSALLAQKSSSPRYFWPRPSAANFATVASGASNKGPTSVDLLKAIADRRTQFGAAAPGDLLTASGSGLDPHLSPAAAHFQAERVAQARQKPVADIHALIEQNTEGPQWGFLGDARVNVLALNLALDALR